nr:RecName: Full=Malate dehydrogenase, mitochondrial [Nicotiana tabacum]
SSEAAPEEKVAILGA